MHFNVTAHPTAPWVWRQLLEATPWGQQPRYLIRDRDRSYGGAFIYKARAIGIKTVLTAAAEGSGGPIRVAASPSLYLFYVPLLMLIGASSLITLL